MYELIGDIAYHYSVKCTGCQKDEPSETIVKRHLPGIDSAERAREEKEFSKRLEQRGWNLKPPMCKECCDKLVVERVGDAFKNAIAAKTGEGK